MDTLGPAYLDVANFTIISPQFVLAGLYAEILKGGFYFDLVGNPRCGDLGVQPPDTDKF